MVTWTEISSTNVAELQETATRLNIHPLALEDCIHKDQRPKLEDYEVHQFLVWFLMSKGKIYEIQFLIFPHTLIMVHHEAPPEGASWKEFLKISEDSKDIWHLLYHTLDHSTDLTWQEIRRLSLEIDKFEQKIFKTEFNPQSLLTIKKQLNRVDYSIGHLPSVVTQLRNFCHPKDDLNWKLRDLHDHCERIYSSISLFREQIGTTIDLYWGYHATRTNQHIKKLSLLAAMAVPLTFWASFWGMNFETIPFSSPWLLGLALLIMAGSVAITIWYLVKKGYWSD